MIKGGQTLAGHTFVCGTNTLPLPLIEAVRHKFSVVNNDTFSSSERRKRIRSTLSSIGDIVRMEVVVLISSQDVQLYEASQTVMLYYTLDNEKRGAPIATAV